MNVEEFQIINSLGIGRSGTVFKALWHGKEVALKLCDIEHNPEYEQELLTEIEVYNQLQDLQGWCIPRLIMAGYYGYLFLGIVTEVVGSPIEVDQLKDSERSKIVKALSKIHQSGFLHNDIREDNILAQRDKGGFRPCFIDFAFSKRNRNNTLFSDEMSELKQLLNS